MCKNGWLSNLFKKIRSSGIGVQTSENRQQKETVIPAKDHPAVLAEKEAEVSVTKEPAIPAEKGAAIPAKEPPEVPAKKSPACLVTKEVHDAAAERKAPVLVEEQKPVLPPFPFSAGYTMGVRCDRNFGETPEVVFTNPETGEI